MVNHKLVLFKIDFEGLFILIRSDRKEGVCVNLADYFIFPFLDQTHQVVEIGELFFLFG